MQPDDAQMRQAGDPGQDLGRVLDIVSLGISAIALWWLWHIRSAFPGRLVPGSWLRAIAALVVGGGVIGMEFASIFSTFGIKVTSLEGTSELMSYYPQPVKDWIARNGGLTTEMKKIKNGVDLWKIVDPCPEEY